MRLAGYELSHTESDGIAVVIFFSGCSRGCIGCHNPELQDKNYGKEIKEEDLFEEIDKIFHLEWIDTIVLSGGDPVEQPESLKLVSKRAKDLKKEVWIYTGYGIDCLSDDLIENVDVIIDGPFVESKKTDKIKFKGSTNQKIWKKNDLNQWEEINE